MQLTEWQKGLLLIAGTEEDIKHAEAGVVEYDFDGIALGVAREKWRLTKDEEAQFTAVWAIANDTVKTGAVKVFASL